MAVRRFALVLLFAACGHNSGSNPDAAVDGGYVPDACEGSLQCFQFDCAAKGLPPTTLSGTVYAPNGTLPLYGVDVYVPASDPGPLTTGAQCSRCDQGLQGGALAATKTDEAGKFVLEGVPATADVPLVIQTGKWRRQITIKNVAACEDQALDPVQTRLPKNRTEGDMPKIAISTGGADALECLPLKLGIDPVEFTNPAGGGAIQMFTNPVGTLSNGVPTGQGADKFTTPWAGGAGQAFGASQTLWSTVDNLKPYDIVFLSCEGNQYPDSKKTTGLAALKAYADLGGRVFLSHWHNVWLEGAGTAAAPAEWLPVATWNNSGTSFNSQPYQTTNPAKPDFIDEVNNPKGKSFADWMINVGGSTINNTTVRGQIAIQAGKQTVTGVDLTKGERWTTWTDANNVVYPQNFQFTTPIEKPAAERCGKVAFSDMHVSSGSTSDPTKPFPTGCNLNQGLTPQEKALSFMFFDIASCVGAIF